VGGGGCVFFFFFFLDFLVIEVELQVDMRELRAHEILYLEARSYARPN